MDKPIDNVDIFSVHVCIEMDSNNQPKEWKVRFYPIKTDIPVHRASGNYPACVIYEDQVFNKHTYENLQKGIIFHFDVERFFEVSMRFCVESNKRSDIDYLEHVFAMMASKAREFIADHIAQEFNLIDVLNTFCKTTQA